MQSLHSKGNQQPGQAKYLPLYFCQKEANPQQPPVCRMRREPFIHLAVLFFCSIHSFVFSSFVALRHTYKMCFKWWWMVQVRGCAFGLCVHLCWMLNSWKNNSEAWGLLAFQSKSRSLPKGQECVLDGSRTTLPDCSALERWKWAAWHCFKVHLLTGCRTSKEQELSVDWRIFPHTRKPSAYTQHSPGHPSTDAQLTPKPDSNRSRP